MTIPIKKIDQNRDMFIRLVEETERPGIENLIAWVATTDFFQAPASTRIDYHGAHEGGLCQHSLSVYTLFKEKVERFGIELADDEIVIASLFHDICKVDFYVPNILKSGEVSETKPYKVQDDFPLGHGEKSLHLVSRHIDLTDQEALLIRWHMGNYDAEWENYREKVAAMCPGVYAFRFADEEASKYMDMRVVR